MEPNPHGSSEVMNGKLTGQTDTDYFYFWCPNCGPCVLRILDYQLVRDENPKMFGHLKPKAKRDFVIVLELFCNDCKMRDWVKVGNTGWQGGDIRRTGMVKHNINLAKGDEGDPSSERTDAVRGANTGHVTG